MWKRSFSSWLLHLGAVAVAVAQPGPPSPAPEAVAASPVSTEPPMAVQVGSVRVPLERGVVLKTDLPDATKVREMILPVIHSMAPGMISTAVPEMDRVLEITLHWKDVTGHKGAVPLQGKEFPLRPTHPGLHEFYLVWKDPVLGFELRIPESPRTFHLESAPSSARVEILEGRGTVEEIFGEKIPVWIKVKGYEQIERATLFAREGVDGDINHHPMELSGTEDVVGTFEAFLPHPMGAGATLEYWILLEDREGIRVEYGSPTSPHRLRPRPLE